MSALIRIRQASPEITGFGLILLLLCLPTGAALLIDSRELLGQNVWVKPLKFLISVGVYAVTVGWVVSFLPAGVRRGWAVRGIAALLIVTGLFEVVYIAWQAGQGQASHFNLSSQFHLRMYNLMGLGALILTTLTLPLAWLIARRTPDLPGGLRLALVLGLILNAVLGCITGFAMGAQSGHSPTALPGDTGLPVVGWSTTGGDYRVAHFFGLHSLQAVPLVGWLTRHWPDQAKARRLVWGCAGLLVLVTGATLAQAVMGLPLIRL